MKTETTPKIICLCGSTKFKEAFEKAERDIALRGEICLTVGLFGHIEGLDMNGETKRKLDILHLQKIDLADEIFVLNVGGYVGDSSLREISYAMSMKKSVVFLEEKFAIDTMLKAKEKEFKWES